jgi:hypothetical protein
VDGITADIMAVGMEEAITAVAITVAATTAVDIMAAGIMAAGIGARAPHLSKRGLSLWLGDDHKR